MAIGDNLYTVEINDSEFEREGWKRGRYKGTKLTAAQINKFTEGDVTFGKEPVIEQYSKTIYVFNKANSSFESNAGIFYPTTDEFTQTLPDKTIIDTTNFKIDRAVTFNINDPSDFSQIEPGANENDPSFHLFDTQVKHDLALFNTCSVRFFDNANNGFVKPQYIVGYNRGEFKPAAAYFQSSSAATNVIAEQGTDHFNYTLSANARLYINPNVEEWYIAQDNASGSQGTLTLGNTAITIDHNGTTTDINGVEGYLFELSKTINSKNPYYIVFNQGSGGPGVFKEKNIIKAFDIHQLAESGSAHDFGSSDEFKIVTTGRYGSTFAITYPNNSEEYVIFREFISNNTIHLNFNLATEAPAGVGDGGVIIPSNLHPKIKESLNTFLSNAGLGAQGGTGGNFGLGGVTAVEEEQQGSSLIRVTNAGFGKNDDGPATSPAGGGGKASDIRLKENIIFLRKSLSGIPIYKFNYKGKSETYTGTMAQDLLKLGLNKAVSKDANGYYLVNYNLIDVDMKKV